jgi:hypothetical protein
MPNLMSLAKFKAILKCIKKSKIVKGPKIKRIDKNKKKLFNSIGNLSPGRKIMALRILV